MAGGLLVTPSPSKRGWSSARSSAASAWGEGRPGGGWAHAAHETPRGGTVPSTPAVMDARSAQRGDAPLSPRGEEPAPAASEQWRYNSAFDAVGGSECASDIKGVRSAWTCVVCVGINCVAWTPLSRTREQRPQLHSSEAHHSLGLLGKRVLLHQQLPGWQALCMNKGNPVSF